MSSTNISINVNKPACFRVIVTAEEVIEARLGIEEVAAVTEGVGVGDVGDAGGDNAALSVQHGRIAPGVVLILIEQVSAGVNRTQDIALQVFKVIVIGRVVFVPYNRIIVIDKGHAARGGVGVNELTVIVDIAVG